MDKVPGNPSDSIYPARSRRQAMIVDLAPGRTAWIAGRIIRCEGGWLELRDGSGSIALESESPAEDGGLKDLNEGDIVEVEGQADQNNRFHVSRYARLAPGRSRPPVESPNQPLWSMPKDLFHRRRRMRDALRAFFLRRGFTEVESPILVPAPGQEPHLEPFRTRLEDGRGGRDLFLITSPEYFHKRLLSTGFERIFEVARVFRNGSTEMHGLHRVEFTMVEWYRAFASYLEIMEDVEALVHCLALETGRRDAAQFAPPFPRISMEEAFERFAGVDLEPYLHGDPDFALLEAREGRYGLDPKDPPVSRYFKILVGGVEPALAREGPVFLLDYPASEAALSKLKPARPEVAERFELYIHGVELANGFTELNDPEAQRRRFEAEGIERAALGGDPVPRDGAFLEALELGMPPSGGVALGFDRLLMVLFSEDELARVMPFPMIAPRSSESREG